MAGVAARALGLCALAITPAQGSGADQAERASATRVTPRTLPPTSVHAIIRTIALPSYGRAVGAGPDLGDNIYIAAGNGFGGQLLRIDPVTLTTTGQVAVQNYPKGLAVSADDTVYVVNADSDSLSVVRGASMTTAATVSLPDEPQSVGISRLVDDTIFVSSRGTSNKVTTIDAHSLTEVAQTPLGMAASPYGLAVASDDSVYISSYGGDKIRLFRPVSASVTDASAALGPIGVAISDDDTVYYSNESGNTVKGFAASAPGTQTSVAVTDPQGLAVGEDGAIYVAGRSSRRISVINPQTFAVDDSVSFTGNLLSVAVTRSGLVVTASAYTPHAWVMAAVSPSLTTTTAFAGEVGSLSISGLPAGVTVDDTTVTSISFGDDTVPWTRTPGTNTFTWAIPPGAGSVDVVVSLNGGNRAHAGSFTYAVTPPPPPTPADPPSGASAVPGDSSAVVSWSAPALSGSFPVSYYLVTSSPGGRTCLTSSLSCTVTGLTNGTAYTFTVQALTGAGWSAASAPSEAVTPVAPMRPTITITGAREGKRITVSGSTTGMGMGGRVTPWTSREGAIYVPARDLSVSVEGTFAWSRRANTQATWRVYFTAGDARSNTVTIS